MALFPTAYKPLNTIILSTGIFLGTNDIYVQQEVDFVTLHYRTAAWKQQVREHFYK